MKPCTARSQSQNDCFTCFQQYLATTSYLQFGLKFIIKKPYRQFLSEDSLRKLSHDNRIQQRIKDLLPLLLLCLPFSINFRPPKRVTLVTLKARLGLGAKTDRTAQSLYIHRRGFLERWLGWCMGNGGRRGCQSPSGAGCSGSSTTTLLLLWLLAL
jgi:hypothetical protein